MIKVIHIDCADWFSHSEKKSVYHLLLERVFETRVEVVGNLSEADVALVGPYGQAHHSREFRSAMNVWKLYITGEPTTADFRLLHHSLSFSPISYGNRNYRFPVWMGDLCWDPQCHSVLSYEESVYLLSTNRSPYLQYPKADGRQSKFVAVFNNPELTRMYVFDQLVQRGLCDGIGRPFGTEQKWAGGLYNHKLETLLKYKANMCFENTNYIGYVTEKIFHSKLAGCLTFTWGSAYRESDFVADNVLDYGTMLDLHDDELCEFLKKAIDQYDIASNTDVFTSIPQLAGVEEFLQLSYSSFKAHGSDLLNDSRRYYPGINEPCFPKNQLISKLVGFVRSVYRNA